MIQIGTVLQDRYLIEKQIGAGGMGAVYLAVDQRFESYVAIKETFYTDDEFGEAFEREARILNGLHHPVLPHVSDFFTEAGGHFLVMQFIEGADLSAILNPGVGFPVKDVLQWMDSLLDALDYLHSQEPPVIHRDVKPQNLKLTLRGGIILLDFGLAKFSSKDNSDVKSLFGYSRKYSPLEQIQGTGTDARSDIFSLGATAYHLLTGKPPVDVLARASAIVVGNPDPLRLVSEINEEVPVAIANIINSAMELDAAKRFVSAQAMRQALTNASDLELTANADKLPEQVSAHDKPQGEIINHSEAESFPALAAFAAEAGNLPLTDNDGNEGMATVKSPISTVQDSLPAPQVLSQSDKIADLSPKNTPRVYQSWFPIAALTAFLLCVGLASAYFINRANSAEEANQTKELQPIVESGTNSVSTENIGLPEPEESNSPISENIEQAKAKPVSAAKNIDRNEAVDEPAEKVEITEKPKSVPVQTERKRPNTAQTSRRSETQNGSQTRPRIANSESVPDIESIFTGRARNENRRNQGDRRPQRDEMSDDEWEEIRRERRQQRRQRQGKPFPF